MELVVSKQFTTVFSGPGMTSPDDAALYINGTQANETFTTSQISPSIWSVTFTPISTGVYTFFAFGEIQFRIQSSVKSTYDYLANIEDEAMGSWSWNKETGTLTVYRQNGAVLAIHKVEDNLSSASRERLS